MLSKDRQRYIKLALFSLLSLYLMLFVYRFISGYYRESAIVTDAINITFSSSDVKFSKRNYAGFQIKSAPNAVVDQKYEKIANLYAHSAQYDQDEKLVYDCIKQHQALIQYEQKEGLKGQRKVFLTIGVQPNYFDSMVDRLKNIGNLASIVIDKVDKTNEYKELNARRESLLKSSLSLQELKKKPGSLSDLINLEQRLLQLEDTIQKLGVQLGDYDTENEFCTVKYSLQESKATANITLFHRIKVALIWSMQVYAAILGVALLSLLVAIGIVIFIQLSLKLWEQIQHNYDKNNPKK